MKIMTFNIRGALYDDGINHWPHRADLNARTILKYSPDLIGLQEAHQENLDYYHAHLPEYKILRGYAYNNDAPHQYTSIMWKPESLAVLDRGGFWLSETPEVLSGSWETACYRSATWIIFRWLPTGDKFIHLNTHLDHISGLARQKGAEVILSHLGQIESLSTVVTADFNCMPSSETYKIFKKAGFADTYPSSSEAAFTYHGYQGANHVPKPQDVDRIDWILLRDWQAIASLESCEIIRDGEPPIFPSDHFPILAGLKLDGRISTGDHKNE